MSIKDFKKWQNIPQTTIDALSDFMFWVEYEYNFGTSDSIDASLKDIQKLIDTYCLSNQEQIKEHEAVESKLLERWKGE